LFYLGVATAYFLVIPLGFRFLIHYSDSNLGLLTSLVVQSRLTLSLSEQVAFTQRFLLVFGFVFQTPLFMALLSRLGLLSATFFARYRRHALVLCFVAAAVLTPPDPLTMVGLALPLVLLYEVGIQLARLVGGKTPPPGKAEESGV
jgi:sec-independent protein translocase protein TatC